MEMNDRNINIFDAQSMFVLEFESSDPSIRFLFGANRYAEALIKLYKFAGVIDETSKESHWYGIPIIPINQLPDGAMVICTATGRPNLAMSKLAKMCVWSIDYFSFLKLRPKDLPQIRFNEDFNIEFFHNKNKFEKTYELLGDLESKKIFAKLIDFRLNQNLSSISDFHENFEGQYFDDCIQLQKNGETFFDVGGFEGETTLAFFKRVGSLSRASVFEPEPKNLLLCHANLLHLPNVTIHDVALSDGQFSGTIVGEGSNARLEASAKHLLRFAKLDDYAHANPTFIKIDVEGHEMNVLAGAKKVLTQMSPKLAIATYHKPDHFWRIPEFILSFQPNYQLFIRHYTESIYESVFYFLPKNAP
jgi:FkbM family methyltransferase